METIKVNMAPCDEVQTIHASQDDNEAREWGFELHNNGELIDTSDVTEQMFFKAYKGGTEQLLPENTSTPTTSPFLGDIRYPQGLLTDQEFTYRQSPTEKDGNAKITDIKGNTLVWNQLIEKGNMTDGWAFSNSTGSYANNILTFTATAQGGFVRPNLPQRIISGHKYLGTVDVKGTSEFSSTILFVGRTEGELNSVTVTTSWQTFAKVFTNTVTENNYYPRVSDRRSSGWDAVQVRNCMLIDLTQMGLDSITSATEFTSLFPLPFYQYEQGKLLSFNGTGIKTVSKNQFDTQVATTSYQGLTLTKTQGTIRAVYSGGSQYAGFNFYGSPVFTDTFLKGRYRLSFDVKGLDTQWTVGLRQGASFLGGGQALAISNDGHYSFTIDTEANPNCYLSFARTGNRTTAYDVTFSNIQLELGTTETSYTPFEEQTISLPISQYFPTGMKSAGNVYDELTESKAITRIGVVDLGSLTWGYDSTNRRFTSRSLSGLYNYKGQRLTPFKSAVYTILSNGEAFDVNQDMVLYSGGSSDQAIIVQNHSYTDATAFKTAMSGVYLYYELATPTETSFTTASLVTENAEIPLSNEDGILIGKCTEELSAEPGFHDAKIKLADDDGTCYSNKLQLHVERSPQ